jgi:predicted HicB family RNase H-like nuclease
MSGTFNVALPLPLAEQVKRAAQADARSAANWVKLAVRERLERESAPAEERKL